MAQHDYIIANQSGAAFRSDLNNGLAAIVSQNSGAAQPSTTYAYQWWADTTTGLLKLRNAANNAWITIGTLADANLGLAPLASPTFTGTPAAPTASVGTNTTQLATTAFVLANAVDVTGDTMTGNLTVPSLNGGPLAGFRNLLINANPTINQRGYVSGTVTTVANQYTLDRWRVVTSGQKIDFTDSSEYRTVAAPAGGCEQLIEGASIRPGTYTLNWVGTATATVDGNAISKGGNITLAGGNNVQVRFINGTFALPQLEPGPVATPFEQRPIGTELALCQRYFEVGTSAWTGYAAAGIGVGAHVSYAATKRAVPTVTTTPFDYTNASGSSVANNTIYGFMPFGTTTALSGVIVYNSFTASAEL